MRLTPKGLRYVARRNVAGLIEDTNAFDAAGERVSGDAVLVMAYLSTVTLLRHIERMIAADPDDAKAKAMQDRVTKVQAELKEYSLNRDLKTSRHGVKA